MSKSTASLKDFLFGIQKSRDKDKLAEITTMADRKNILSLKIVVIIDISGSISEHMYKSFLNQLNKIRGLSTVKVLEADTDICSMYTYQFGHEKIKNRVVKLYGGGGTDFITAFAAAKKMKPDAILLFTDGYDGGNLTQTVIPTGVILTASGRHPYSWMTKITEIKGT